jgi:hypothetical protein
VYLPVSGGHRETVPQPGLCKREPEQDVRPIMAISLIFVSGRAASVGPKCFHPSCRPGQCEACHGRGVTATQGSRCPRGSSAAQAAATARWPEKSSRRGTLAVG